MRKRIQNYLKQTDALINDQTKRAPKDWELLIKEHLIQISFFQHERLIHLLVTLAFALMTVATLITIIITGYMYLILLFVLLMVLLVPYVFHYFILENGVQKMYEQYDRMKQLSETTSD